VVAGGHRLTLHGDWFHVASNVIAALIFFSAVGRWLGGGLGASLILVSATAGNLMNAIYHRTDHNSVGASTATFAALGSSRDCRRCGA
jgi:membrane associated rhomboid family serine protease